MKISKVLFTKKLPNSAQLGKEVLVIFDRKLLSKVSQFKKWLGNFDYSYGVEGGEKIKSVKELPLHLEKILKIASGMSRELTVVVVGGGSIGDFGGFIASVLKRGVRLIHIPSTWLSAIDSAHGGKTALNVENTKNQIGTFYPAEIIFVVQEILISQPVQRQIEALGEIIKMGLLNSKIKPNYWQKFFSSKKLTFNEFRNLKKIISAKYEIVKKDPFERKGQRKLLNLGHTIGHGLESQLKLSHGEAVGQGLIFACEWSRQLGYLDDVNFSKIQKNWFAPFGLKRFSVKGISRSDLEKQLGRDKKRTPGNKIDFVFIKGIGKPILRKISIAECCQEAERQGLVRR